MGTDQEDRGMMWLLTLLTLLLAPGLSASLSISTDPETSVPLNQSEAVTEDFPESSGRSDRPLGRGRSREGACTVPCDVTAKLFREEKHSFCGHMQQSLQAYGKSTRKLLREAMEEQHRALDTLTSQVAELVTKVQILSSEVQRSNSEMYSIKPVQSHGRDCSDIKDTLGSVVPKIPSGIYIIHPDNSETAFEVFCEMDYMGGGWTVIQRRTDGLTDFRRPWSDYADGFGHLPGEHWLGLRKVFSVVNQRETRFQLHVALASRDDVTSYASYDDFRLDNDTLFYTIHLGRYAGSAGDAFRGYDQDHNQDTAPFSTWDVDNDGCSPYCSSWSPPGPPHDHNPNPPNHNHNLTVESCSAQHNRTGWWFNRCGLANLNGCPGEARTRAEDAEDAETPRIHWDTWTQGGVPHTVRSVTMKIRRINTNN